MILVADSGSSKTDWLFAGAGKEIKQFRTTGLNPYFFVGKRHRKNPAAAAPRTAGFIR